ncbi:aldehyde dehydrogenase [Leucogyrophana mollusca]|uniref:Aldehyde dehydrogenase n=1 Tax=Leucogyrophana mollusca TaxID=85980 RepID=A0ACB8BU58_9AGAM|nr:aldehyde dehydrogenase [Leucogyrophana mollusca]
MPPYEAFFTQNFTHVIAGRKVTSEAVGQVVNPATEQVIATVPIASKAQLDETVQAAWDSYPSWAATSWERRQELVSRIGTLVEEELSQFIELLIKEAGKSRALAEIEVGSCAAWLHAVAKQSLPDEIVLDTPDRTVVTRYVPLGVCAAITPWNFPLSLMMWKVAPALVTGNCVIVKPSPFAPLTTMKFVELAQQVLPPGVLSVLSGNDDLGPWISSHPSISRISLTGSTTAGKSAMQLASSTLKRLTLELGGNDPAIVCGDVDAKAIAPHLFWSAFHNSGQICVAVKRLYIHSSIYTAVRDELAAYARNIVVGDGLDPRTGVGPVQNKKQYEIVKSLIDDSKKNGYNFALGGDISEHRKGYFIPITLIDNPPDNARVVQEEQFGPILPLLKWDDVEDVIQRANDSKFGLAASVWANDISHAQSIATRLEAGTVWINEAQQFHWDQPFGGFKHSGIGVEHSKHGLYSWCNIQTITQNKIKFSS